MAYTPIRLYQGQPGTTEATLYTAGGAGVIIKELLIANTSSSAANISLSLVPSGGSAGSSNRLLSNIAVPGSGVAVFDLSQVMAAGDFLSGLQATSGALALTISGVAI
jgi:hypothetical protein